MEKSQMASIQERYEYAKDDLRQKHHVESLNLLEQFGREFAEQNEEVRISELQRTFLIGYKQASRLAEWMVMEGIIESPNQCGVKRSLIFTGK